MTIKFGKKPSEVEKLKAEEAAAAEAAKVKAAEPVEAPSKGKLLGKAAVGKGKAKVTANVTKEVVNNKTGETVSSESDVVDVDVPQASAKGTEQLPVIGYSSGFTYNMGDFNSVKCNVHLSVPVAVDEINDGFDFIKEWVDSRVQSIHAEVSE